MTNLTAEETVCLHTYLEVMLSKNEQHFGEVYAKDLNEALALIIAKLKCQEKALFTKRINEG